MKKLLLIMATVFFIQMSNAQTDSLYFGQTPPGDKAVIFAPGIISLTNRFEGSIAFSPDGSECYFTVEKNINNEWSGKIYYTEYVNNKWTEQVETPFSKSLSPNFISRPFLSADGNRLYFTNEGDIWMIERTAEGWSEPQSLPAPINSASSDGSYSETSDGVVYFFSDRPGGFGKYADVWCKHPSSNEVENLGAIVNSKSWQYSPCIAPDGSFLIFQRTRTSDTRFQDLFISFRKENNEWTVPLNMEESGAGINIPLRAQINPSLSPDGKYLFFCRHDDAPTINDIYWVSTSIIDTLKKIAMPTTLVNQAIDKKAMLYPNPTNGHITLSLGTSQNREALVEIYNLQGAQVFSKTFQNTPSATIDLTGNPAGIYLVKVIAGGVSYEEKILKE